MMHNQVVLSENWINYLLNLPESGMGYQLVNVILTNGKILKRHKVLNSSILMLEANEAVELKDIEQILPDGLSH